MTLSYYARYCIVVSLNTYLLTIYNIKITCFSFHSSHNQNYDKPKMKLPNIWCFRKPYSSSNDCCQKHNIYDASAYRCIDPCKRNSDCCERFPTYDGNACKNWKSNHCICKEINWIHILFLLNINNFIELSI